MKTAEEIFYEVFKKRPVGEGLEQKILQAMKLYADQFRNIKR